MSGAIAQAASDTGMGLTLLPVLYEVGGCDGRPLGPGQRRFGSTTDSFSGLVEAARAELVALPADTGHGIAPHSLRAVTINGLHRAIELAGNGPIHMHVAEQVAEIQEVKATLGARPVEWLMDNTSVGPHWCMIHLTHMTDAETEQVAASGAVAGLCPITESSLGDGIFKARHFAAHQGRFGIGSDSNLRISLAEELRTLEYSQRLHHRARAVLATEDRSTGRVLLEGAAHGGAQALRRASGAIAPGLWADMAALDPDALDLQGREGDVALDTWIFAGDNRMVSDVWSAGRHLVSGGRHRARDEIEARYRATLARLTDRL
jgi:formimidoylglutamate deiminase